MRTFNELCGLSWNKNAMIARCGGGGNDSSSSSSDNDSSSSSSSSSTMTNQDRINEIYANSDDPWGTDGAELNALVADRDGTYNGGSSSNNSSSNNSSSSSSSSSGYISFKDRFDGGGPGKSGDSFSTVDNSALDTDGDGHISTAEAGGKNLAGGIDGSEGLALDFNGDGRAWTSIGDMFDGGGMGASGDTYSTGSNLSLDTNNDGHISYAETSAGQNGNNNLPGGIDGSDNLTFKDATGDDLIKWMTDTSDNNPINNGCSGGSDSSSNDGGGSSTNTNTTTTTNTGSTDTSNDLNADLLAQIADLQSQLDALQNASGGGGTTIVYEGSGGTETALPDDYLTEADLARYFDNLDLGSSAYDPAAFLNAYGFALDPAAFGGIIPTFSNTNGVYMRRAVKDKDTGEIRYVNVPIGAGATMGNDGLSMFRNERRTGFGSFL